MFPRVNCGGALYKKNIVGLSKYRFSLPRVQRVLLLVRSKRYTQGKTGWDESRHISQHNFSEVNFAGHD